MSNACGEGGTAIGPSTIDCEADAVRLLVAAPDPAARQKFETDQFRRGLTPYNALVRDVDWRAPEDACLRGRLAVREVAPEGASTLAAAGAEERVNVVRR